MGLGDQMMNLKQGRSPSHQNSIISQMNSLLAAQTSANPKSLGGNSRKSKSSNLGGLDPQQTQQLYEQMKNQQ